MQGLRGVTFSDSDEFVDLTEILGHCNLKTIFEVTVECWKKCTEETERKKPNRHRLRKAVHRQHRSGMRCGWEHVGC